jgi:peptide methionine sulfoxide reductase msrA/msrB
MITKIISSRISMLLMLSLVLQVFTACSQNKNETKTDKGIVMNEDSIKPIQKSEEEWQKQLTSEQYYILREKGTERPFTGKLLMNKEKGVYKCAACDNELFTDEMKFDSHCGWPSFDKEISGGKIKKSVDRSHGMIRTEITCARCGSHLGHLFDDGPTETGQRYCVNSLSLEFVNEKEMKMADLEKNTIDTITLGGGCFWCVEAIYQKLEGVVKAESGYSGGKAVNPTYEDVCEGTTGHAEVVQITFDTRKTSLDEIFKVFFTIHNPTTLNRQGADAGTQYRSVVFYRNFQQEQAARSVIADLTRAKVFDNPIVTQITPFTAFYKAENYHQDYYNRNKMQPYCRMIIFPKMEKFEKVFKERLKK